MQVNLLVCCTQVNCHPLPEKNQGIQRNGMLTKRDKRRGHEENSILFLSSLYILLFQSTTLNDIVSNQMNAKHMIMTQYLDSTSTNNLSRQVTQCAHV